ncbi:MAG: hotdog domain-containing protein [Pseudomonadota bacterium]
MPDSEIKAGLGGESRAVVSRQDLASAYGNPGVDVMSSMTLMTLLEQAAISALAGHLGPGQMTVGARMEMDHLAPTPEGFTVTARAVLSEVAGRKLVFSITASDGLDTVARATHIRYVVESQRFLQGVADKLSRR